MNRDAHLDKARRVLASLRKLPPESAAMCIVDGAMIAGYHLGNALLHSAGVCPDDQHFNTPSKLDRPVGSLPDAVRPAFEAFTELEKLRSTYVRSPNACDAQVPALVSKHLTVMTRACKITI